MPEEKHSLSDEQIKADYRTDPDFLPRLMREMAALETRIGDAGDSEETSVPVESLRTMRMGMLAMVKSQTEFAAGFGFDADRGDRGPNCDYNPFIRVNTGDLLPHIVSE
jgi:hypothetical protein